ncbi:MAG: c-type cytochrome [Desulfobacteraceae bacterium]|nr:c-type cytochrome [Desulfobacteraceae bacterium]
MRKRLVLAMAFWWAMALPAAALAADGATLFLQKCGGCHKKGGQAAPVNPADKASVVWDKYFARGRHPVDLAKTMSNQELQSVIQYLKQHAADSDQPAAAVIPN